MTDLKFNETSANRFTTEDELVEVYMCQDGTWRVAYYPYADKDRNLTREEAFALADTRHTEAEFLLQWLSPARNERPQPAAVIPDCRVMVGDSF